MSLTLDNKRSFNLNYKMSKTNSNMLEHFEREKSRANVERVSGIPRILITQYANAAMRHAITDQLDDCFFSEIKNLNGIYGEGETSAEALSDLRSSLTEWLERKIKIKAPLPTFDGVAIPTSFNK